MRNAEIKQNNPLHMQELLLTTPTKMYMCVATQMYIKIYVNCTTKQTMTSQVLLYHNVKTCIESCTQ